MFHGLILPSTSVFVNKVFEFLGMGFALYGLAILYEALSKDPIIKHTVKCRYCKKPVNVKVCRTPSKWAPPAWNKVH